MKIPYFPQTELFWCGPAATQMLLAYYGIERDQDELQKALKEGTSLSNIKAYLKTLDFESDLEKLNLEA